MENDAGADGLAGPLPAASPQPAEKARQPFAVLRNGPPEGLPQGMQSKRVTLALARSSMDVSSLSAAVVPHRALARSGSSSDVTAAKAVPQGSAALADLRRATGQFASVQDTAARQRYAGLLLCCCSALMAAVAVPGLAQQLGAYQQRQLLLSITPYAYQQLSSVLLSSLVPRGS